MSGSRAMSKNIMSGFYELVSDVKDEIVNSDDEREITLGGPQEEPEQDTNSKLELNELNYYTNQNETSSVEDEIHIKYEVNDMQNISNVDDDLDIVDAAILSKINSKTREHESTNSDVKELNQLYLDLLKCERDCETCQEYIRKLSQHVRVTHAADQPARDLQQIDPLDMNQIGTIGIKCEVDENIDRMDCSEESDSNFESEVENGSESDPDYNTSYDLNQKCKSRQKLVNDQDRKSSLTVHMRIHTEKEPHQCAQCEKSFTQRAQLIAHMRIHTTQKPFKCELCGKSFITKNNLTMHEMTHTGEERFMCELCDQSFAARSYLTDHLKIHTGQKLFVCEECGKSFTKKSSLTTHRARHTGERAFKCNKCDKSYRTNGDLITHKGSHNGEKSFKCEHCPSSFKRKPHLLVHLTTHSGERPYNCEECGKCFKTTSSLSSHCKSHNEEKPYKCDMCEKDFKRPRNLYAHKKNCHNKL